MNRVRTAIMLAPTLRALARRHSGHCRHQAITHVQATGRHGIGRRVRTRCSRYPCAGPRRRTGRLSAPRLPVKLGTGSACYAFVDRSRASACAGQHSLIGMSGKPASRPAKSSTHTGPGRAAEWPPTCTVRSGTPNGRGNRAERRVRPGRALGPRQTGASTCECAPGHYGFSDG